jgi:hypothetical protein
VDAEVDGAAAVAAEVETASVDASVVDVVGGADDAVAAAADAVWVGVYEATR